MAHKASGPAAVYANYKWEGMAGFFLHKKRLRETRTHCSVFQL